VPHRVKHGAPGKAIVFIAACIVGVPETGITLVAFLTDPGVHFVVLAIIVAVGQRERALRGVTRRAGVASASNTNRVVYNSTVSGP
jgi:hypothetical protein